MLRKMMKYDLKATARYFVPACTIAVALSLLCATVGSICQRISFHQYSALNITSNILYFLYGVSMAVLGLLPIIVCICYFYNNLFKTEGYLIHTLPVRPSLLIWSKLLVTAIWILVSSVLQLLTMLIVTGNYSMSLTNFPTVVQRICTKYAADPWFPACIVLAILCVFIGIIFAELHIFVSMSISSLAPKHHSLVGAVAVIGFAVVHIVLLVNVLLCAEYVQPKHISWLQKLITATTACEEMAFFLLAVSAYLALFSVLYFVITRVILQKHLNLE